MCVCVCVCVLTSNGVSLTPFLIVYAAAVTAGYSNTDPLAPSGDNGLGPASTVAVADGT